MLNVRTITLPAVDGKTPAQLFAVDRIKLRVKLTSINDDVSYIIAFNLEGYEVYRINAHHRYWRNALTTVGRMMVYNPSAFDQGPR